jgi:hypothetical protein
MSILAKTAAISIFAFVALYLVYSFSTKGVDDFFEPVSVSKLVPGRTHPQSSVQTRLSSSQSQGNSVASSSVSLPPPSSLKVHQEQEQGFFKRLTQGVDKRKVLPVVIASVVIIAAVVAAIVTVTLLMNRQEREVKDFDWTKKLTIADVEMTDRDMEGHKAYLAEENIRRIIFSVCVAVITLCCLALVFTLLSLDDGRSTG